MFDQDAPDGPDQALIGQAITPLWVGGVALVEGALLNAATSPLRGPIQLLIQDLPAGVTVTGLETTAGTDALDIDLQNTANINASASIAAQAKIRGKFWSLGWSGWKDILTVEVRGSTDPWKLKIRVKVAGFTVKFSIS